MIAFPPLPATIPTMADTLASLHSLGDVPPQRVLMAPLPGTATIADLCAVHASGRKLVELVDGVLVEKAMGTRESFLATLLVQLLANHVLERRLGVVLSPDGMQRIGEALVRAPDVSFIPWSRWPDPTPGEERILSVYPELAIEIRSESDTDAEMNRKVREYFAAGTRLVWLIDPESQTAQVFHRPTQSTTIPREGILSGNPVLPDLQVSLTDLFAQTLRPIPPETHS
jgi:Uma2 family endonuclease